MNKKLMALLGDRLVSGLKRKAITKCSRWAESYRVMDTGLWKFDRYPWLKDMHDSESEFNVGQKAAQMGFTENALNISFYNIDIKGIDVLYVLPAKTPDASDFSASRFDAALELSPHLQNLFSDVKNVGHKRAGNANMFIRGSRSRSGLKSIPVGLIILDEVDEMSAENIPLAYERTSGQVEKQIWSISTPTIPGHGINEMFVDSTQEYFYFKCPACSKFIRLTFPENIEIYGDHPSEPEVLNSYLKCNECKTKLPHEDKVKFLSTGKWVPTLSTRTTRGFAVNQLYSTTVSPGVLAQSFLKSLQNPYAEQEFYNSKLGVEHVVEGAGVTDADLQFCTGDFRKAVNYYGNQIITMGVDVGRWLNYEIDKWSLADFKNSLDFNVQCKPQIINAGKCLDFEQLDQLMREFSVNSCVIDANPERRKAYEFSQRFPNRIKLCFYGHGVSGKQIVVGNENNNEPTITVDRTSWLDLALGRFKQRPRAISLPFDIPIEYREQIKALVRIYQQDHLGNPVTRYEHGSKEDHYAHARNYAEIALNFAIVGSNQNIMSY
jgi:hypothetical protein